MLKPSSLRAPVLHQLEKLFMHAGICGEFGMESGSHEFALAYQDWIAVERRQDLNILAGGRNFRCANKDHFQRLFAECAAALLDKALNLSSVSVPAHADVHNT